MDSFLTFDRQGNLIFVNREAGSGYFQYLSPPPDERLRLTWKTTDEFQSYIEHRLLHAPKSYYPRGGDAVIA